MVGELLGEAHQKCVEPKQWQPCTGSAIASTKEIALLGAAAPDPRGKLQLSLNSKHIPSKPEGTSQVVGRASSARPSTAAAAAVEPPANDSCTEANLPHALPSFQPKRRNLRPAGNVPSSNKGAGAPQAQEAAVAVEGGCNGRPPLPFPALSNAARTPSNCGRLGQSTNEEAGCSKAEAAVVRCREHLNGNIFWSSLAVRML
eukprot:516703-Pelagomonas_calceolata.AAC.1